MNYITHLSGIQAKKVRIKFWSPKVPALETNLI